MNSTREPITESRASTLLIASVVDKVSKEWPGIKDSLADMHGDRFAFEDEDLAEFDLVLAVLALELETARDILPQDQFRRLRQWVIKFVDREEWGDYATEILRTYQDLYEEAMGCGENPVSTIGTILLHRWLSDNVHDFDVRFGEEKTGILSPMILTHVEEILLSLVGTWKQISENFELVEGDVPPDYDEQSAFPQVITSQYVRGSPDSVAWRVVPSTEESGVRGTYRVQVKGPWKGIKEEYWPLSKEDAQIFVDEEDMAHAVCFFEKGEPKYALVVRRVWEKIDEVGDIMRNPALSDEERVEAVRRLNEN